MEKNIWLASISICFCFLCFACENKSSQTISSGAQNVSAASASQPPPVPPRKVDVLASKDSGFQEVINENLLKPTNYIEEYSQTWKQCQIDIEGEVSKINDDNLKIIKRKSLNNKINMALCKKEADAVFNQLSSEYKIKREKYFQEHDDVWFEVAKFYGDLGSGSEPEILFEASKNDVISQNNYSVHISIEEIDAVYSKFKMLNSNSIEQTYNGLIAKVNSIPGSERTREELADWWKETELRSRQAGLILVKRHLNQKEDIGLMDNSTETLLFIVSKNKITKINEEYLKKFNHRAPIGYRSMLMWNGK